MRPEEWERLRAEGERTANAFSPGFFAPVFIPLVCAIVWHWALLLTVPDLAFVALRARPLRREARRRHVSTLCETEYARTHGITPQNFRFYCFPWLR